MKVGLIDVDRRTFPRMTFPNLALMKLSAEHKRQGDEVVWCDNDKDHFDLVYMSKVFTEEYSPDLNWMPNASLVIKGGTGYDLKNSLDPTVEHCYPDYSLYGIDDTAYGFLTRGCPRACPWCIVCEKEGRYSHQVADLDEFYRGQSEIVIMDPNLLACRGRLKLLDDLAHTGAWVDFNQGLDIRLTDEEVAQQLGRIKIKRLHFAWDDPRVDLEDYFRRFSEAFRIKDRRRKVVYVLTNFNSTLEEDLHRIYTLETLGYDPDVRVFDKPNAPKEIRRLQRWCNNRFIHGACKRFEDYKG